MVAVDILSEEFAQAAAVAGLRARREALAEGHPVIFVDDRGRTVQELPDGRRLEVHLRPGATREFHVYVLSELAADG